VRLGLYTPSTCEIATWLSQDCADGDGWADAVDSTAARWHGATRLLLALWQEILHRIPQASASRTDQELHCFDQRVAEVRALWWAFEGDESAWAAAESASGFHACRGLHEWSPTIQLDMEINGTTANGLGFTVANVHNSSDSTLRYQAGTVYTSTTGSDAQRSTNRFASEDGALILGAAEAFAIAGVGAGRQLEEAPRTTDTSFHASKDSKTKAPTLRRRQQSIAGEACGSVFRCTADIWCNPSILASSNSLQEASIGYYSPDQACDPPTACTTIQTQLYHKEWQHEPISQMHPAVKSFYGIPEDIFEIAQYTTSGNGADTCEWVCAQGGYYRRQEGSKYFCEIVLSTHYSPNMSNADLEW
jgi:hypothetical protein